ncbi:MerR family DNA-binding protein [Streptomyces sp. P9(2023)]|uniref:MerR family DNA-binding protein n=1 Tax=Streptomyces sp. P9(2023) TaxID=3064394 RepID=UPI0037DD47D8
MRPRPGAASRRCAHRARDPPWRPAPCDAVRDLLDARIAEIDATVADLLALRRSLAETRKAAEDGRSCEEPSAVCSIIEPREV